MCTARDQTKQFPMVVDSGAEVHLVCLALKHFMQKVTKWHAGEDSALDTIGDLLCGGIVCHGCLFSLLLTFCLFSTTKKRWMFPRERSRGLWSVERVQTEMRSSSALADWITLSAAKNTLIFLHCSPGSVDGSCCRIHILDTEHLRGSHLEFDPVCTTCTSVTDEKATSPTRERQREEDEKLCGRHWKVANGLQRFRVSDGRTLGRHALVLSKRCQTKAARQSENPWWTCSCC